MSLHYPASAIVIKCKMRILKYNYSLLIPFTVKNKHAFVFSLPIQNTVFTYKIFIFK